MSRLNPASVLENALVLAIRERLRFFRLRKNSKLPVPKQFSYVATSDSDTLHEFFAAKDFNGAILCGKYADNLYLVGIDIDDKEGKRGFQTLDVLADMELTLPDTWSQKTPSGGEHRLFWSPVPIRQGVNVLGEGVDTRCEGGYLVSPGSKLDGVAYRVYRELPIARIPQWIIDKYQKAATVHELRPQQKVKPVEDQKHAIERAIEFISARPATPQGARNNECYKLSAAIKDFGVDQSRVFDILAEHWKCEPPLSVEEMNYAIGNAYRYGRAAIGVKAPENTFKNEESDRAPTHKEKPLIRIEKGSFHEIVKKVENALVESGVDLFYRSSSLVEPVVEEVDASNGRKTAVTRLKRATPMLIKLLASEHARFEHYDIKRKKWVPTDPTKDIAEGVLNRDGQWSFRPLAGIITCPTLRPDGSLLAKPGYDPITKMLLRSPPPMPEISARPTKDDAAKALALLSELFSEMPYEAGTASKSVALSFILTAVARGAFPVVPLHAFRAPAPGSGKSMHPDIVSYITAGHACPVIAAGRDEAENEKRLVGILRSGQQMFNMDNVNGEIGGDFLCQLVERPIVQVRVLGTSDVLTFENKITPSATGNGIVLTGDMTRRVLRCSLDANMERPEQRKFRLNPKEMILSNRGVYIAAALTIVRAYIETGCPNENSNLASYGEWSGLIRSALIWLGQPDPVTTMDAARAEDPLTAQFEQVMEGLINCIGFGKTFTAGTLIDELGNHAFERVDGENSTRSDLITALTAIAPNKSGAGISSPALGKWLQRNNGRIAGKIKLVGTRDPHSKVCRWLLKCVAGDAGDCGGSSNPSAANGSAKYMGETENAPATPAPSANIEVPDGLADLV